ncbi:MAG: NAD(P)H-dependent oxidoreductase [Hamadaea sp.]|uniref:NADPH-dependent FMN reductase n=1 Tax=Hamadaea sp. TaxID=2024425 RepID=UPI00180567EB|nr:NAD(P)H-dependent oxidoreductase [Hamadaea sp.]NUR74604.1 NAD(P)H-dependent oxidoreductase [Hamadaea sp.]NUT17620.1 NAD(P)H-dependent oxidoreductase [Hamadaea sp.]
MRVLVMGASLRPGSFNVTLAELAAAMLRDRAVEVDLARYAEFLVPGYDAGVEVADGVPEGARRFAERLQAVDAFVLVSPEYNASVPGTLKNLVDWVSRLKPQPFWGHHGLLLSASPRLTGGNRGLWALRVPLEHLGARMFPEMVSVAQADEAFTVDGRLADENQAKRLVRTIDGFLELVSAVRR